MKKTVVPFLILLLMTACPEDGGRNIDVAPRIDLIGPTEVFFNINDTYIEYGYTATDVDGNDVTSLVRRDISDLNMGKEGSYQISYTAVDRKGVKADPVYRVVNVGDAFAPEITIAGSNPLLVKLGTEFTPPSASALAYDGTDISDSIAVDASSVDTSKVGTYIVSYSVTDASGISGSASLFVYVLESSSPRIIIPEMGSSEESPFQIQNLSDPLIDAESYFYDSLPLFQAFDLEDGDISYKVRVDETSLTASGFLEALKAVPDGTIYELFLTVSDNDGNVPVPLPSFFVAIVADAEPPVITVGAEGPYELEVDMWSNNTSAWIELLESLDVTVWDNSWGAGTPAKPFTPNSVPNDDNNQPLLQELTVEYAALQTALEWTKGGKEGSLDIYDYNDPRSSVNIKAVTFKATDNTGNTSSLPISVRLVDTTPAEILDGNPQIAFGADSIGTEKQLRYRDNSGQEGYCSGLTLEKISNALLQGSFNVDFTAPLLAPDKPSASATIKTAKVTVGSPLNNPSGGTNYMQNNLLNADFDGVNAEWDEMNVSALASGSWWKMQPTVPDKWRYVSGTDRFWRWTATGKDKKKFDSLPAYDRGNLIIGGVKFPTSNSQINALLFSGTRQVESGLFTSAWVTNIRFTIELTEANRNINLYNGVSYCLGYDAANYAAHDSTYGPEQLRSVTFSRTGGSGTFGGQNSVISTYASQDKGIYFPDANTGEKNEADMWHLLASHPSVTNKGGAKDFRSNWMIKNDDTVKVTGGNITAVNVTIQVSGSNDWVNDYGGFISNIRIIPVTWPGKQNLTNPDSQQGFYKYDLSSGAVTWSETE